MSSERVPVELYKGINGLDKAVLREIYDSSAEDTMNCSSSWQPIEVPFSNVVYIEHTDFRIKDSKDYYRLAPGKTFLLRGFCTGSQNLHLELSHLRILLSLMIGFVICNHNLK